MLKLEHNNINEIQDNVFHDLKHLNSLNIEFNRISKISDKAFAGLECEYNLREILFGFENIEYITLVCYLNATLISPKYVTQLYQNIAVYLHCKESKSM